MTQATDDTFMVVDVGGTNTRVALSRDGQVVTNTIKRYRNKDFAQLADVLFAYLDVEKSAPVSAACIAIAGPVRGGVGRLTNRDWEIDAADLAARLSLSHVALLNDLQAQGYALDHVSSSDLLLVRKGRPAAKDAAKLVVNLGTGFNASPVFVTPSGPFVVTSESGHANMPVRDALDLKLCSFVEQIHGFAAIDDILSGRGLEHVYAFLSREAGVNRTSDSADIMEACRDSRDPVAVEAVCYFIRLTAMVMGNLALVQLPFGGIFLVGGLSSAIAPYLEQAGFEAAFRDKGRFAGFMDDFAVHVVQDDYAALKGMAAYLEQRAGH